MSTKDTIYPSYIDNTDFRYIKIDDKYIASIIIYDFPQYNTFLSITEALPKEFEYTMAIYIQKQDTYKVLKNLMYSISTAKSEIKTANQSQIDIDVISKLKDDANLIRKEIQINNQEIFYTNFILTFYSQDEKELLKVLKRFQSSLYSKQLYSKIANFRHLDNYILTLPLNRKENTLLKQNFKNFTTNALSNIFPFYTKTIFDLNGIIFGKILSQNSICKIDMFKNNYLNSNMCILGSSGAGKSFFAKMLIIRHYINSINQYIFDIEGEYCNIVNKLGGSVFSFANNHINILEITKSQIKSYGKNVYNIKINKVVEILKNIFDIYDDEILNDIRLATNKAYKKFEITDDINTLYKKYENKVYLNKILRNSDEFPTLNDVLNEVKLEKTKTRLLSCLKKFPYLFGVTDIEFNNKLVCFNLNSVSLNNVHIAIKYILEEIILNLKMSIKEGKNKEGTLIYIDEIWKYISKGKDNIMAEYVFELFKTIRKLNAGIVVITQDISDIFSKENESYGKSILNNCYFKVIFRLDFSDIDILNKINGVNKNMLESVSLLDKGECLLLFNNNIIKLLVKTNEYEKKLIQGDEDGYFSST